MANPTEYNRGYSFTGYQANSPTDPLPGDHVDVELDEVSRALGETIDGLGDIRRSDGKLVNKITSFDSLDDNLRLRLMQAGNPITVESFDTIAQAAGTTIAVGKGSVLVGGYDAAGDCPPMLFAGVDVEPTHAGKFQDAGGRWWELTALEVDIRMVGGVSGAAAAVNAPALQAAVDIGRDVIVPRGDFDITGTKVFLQSGQKLTVDGNVTGRIATPWTAVQEVTRVTGSGTLSAGATVLHGNFTGFAVDDWLVVRVPDGSGGTTSNAAGWSFHKVSIAGSASQVTVTPGVRYSYGSYTVQKLTGIFQWTGTPTQGSREIIDTVLAGDLIAAGVVAGDVLRIENATGTDTPWAMLGEDPSIPGGEADRSYFEYAVVEILTSAHVVFKDEIAYAHVNPWFVKMNFISGVEIRGNGKVQQMQLDYCSDVVVQDVDSANLSVTNAYHVRVGEVASRRENLSSVDSRTMGFTFVRHLNIVAPMTSGTRWVSDNGALKLLGCIDYTIVNAQAWNTQITSGGSAMVPIFLDFYFTPYSGFCQRGIIQGATAGRPFGGAGISFWASGVRDVWFDNIIAERQFRVGHSSNVRLSNVKAGNFSFEDSRNGIFANNIQFSYCVVNNVDVFIGDLLVTYGTNGDNSNHCFSVLGNTGTVRLTNYHNLSATAADDTYFASNTTLSILDDCSDKVATISVQTGSSPGIIERRGCRFNGTQTGSAAQSGEWQLFADLTFRGSAYNAARMRMGSSHMFLGGSNEFRATINATPASATDGYAFDLVKRGSASWDPALIAAGASTSTTVTVTGAVLGDAVSVGFSTSLGGCIISGYVSSSGVVTVVLFNPTASGIDVSSGSLQVYAHRQ